MKRVFSRAVALLLAAVLFALPAKGITSTSARCHILIDGDTGRILEEKEAHKRSLIASTTKIMTAVVVLESMDPEQVLSIPPEAVGVEGSSLYLKEGEQLSVSDLLYGMMLHSGNDVSVALSIGCCGTVSAFVDRMNEKADTLDLENTHFENPNGLDGKEHYSTAHDLAKLTAYALKVPGFREIVSCKTITVGNRSLRNHNRLLWMMDGIIGVKTGFTKAAGRILVSAMDYKGRTLIAVTIHDGNDWQDHMALYQYGISLYSYRPLIRKGERLCELPTLEGRVVGLYAKEDFSAPTLEGEVPVLELKYPMIPMGHRGTAYVDLYLGDLYLGRISLEWEVGQ